MCSAAGSSGVRSLQAPGQSADLDIHRGRNRFFPTGTRSDICGDTWWNPGSDRAPGSWTQDAGCCTDRLDTRPGLICSRTGTRLCTLGVDSNCSCTDPEGPPSRSGIARTRPHPGFSRDLDIPRNRLFSGMSDIRIQGIRRRPF